MCTLNILFGGFALTGVFLLYFLVFSFSLPFGVALLRSIFMLFLSHLFFSLLLLFACSLYFPFKRLFSSISFLFFFCRFFFILLLCSFQFSFLFLFIRLFSHSLAWSFSILCLSLFRTHTRCVEVYCGAPCHTTPYCAVDVLNAVMLL